MKWLLDTNVICEPGRRRPNAKMVAWLDSLAEPQCALSVLTLGEIEKGIYALPPGPARRTHENALAALWGELMGDAERAGHPLPAVDNLLGATAMVHGLTLATRDTGDIAPGVRVFNPFA